MTTTTKAGSDQKTSQASARDQFLAVFDKEHATTVRVLRALPADQLELRPAPRCNTAQQLAWTFVLEQSLAEQALTTGFDWQNMAKQAPPPPPETMDEIIEKFESGHRRVAELVGEMEDDRLRQETVSFFVKPKTLGDIPKIDFLWLLLHDQIHHRGQFSIYLRIAGGKVPSIYGPTADEPWM